MFRFLMLVVEELAWNEVENCAKGFKKLINCFHVANGVE